MQDSQDPLRTRRTLSRLKIRAALASLMHIDSSQLFRVSELQNELNIDFHLLLELN